MTIAGAIWRKITGGRRAAYVVANLTALHDEQRVQSELLAQLLVATRERNAELMARWASQVEVLELRVMALECEVLRLPQIKGMCLRKSVPTVAAK